MSESPFKLITKTFPVSLVVYSWQRQWPNLCYWLFWAALLALGLKTATAYPDFVADKFWGLNLWWLAGLGWLATTGWQLIWRLKFSRWNLRLLTAITSLLLLLLAFFYSYQVKTTTLNAILLAFGLYFEVLIVLTAIFVTLTLYHVLIAPIKVLPEKWWLLAGASAALLLLVYLQNIDFFIWLGTEDKFFEEMSVAITSAGTIIACILAWRAGRQRPKAWGRLIAFSIWAIGLLFLAGEEISWGQRVLSLEATGIFATTNEQQEINFHNLAGIHQHMVPVYLLLSLWGCGSWLLNLPAVKSWWQQRLPPLLVNLGENFIFSAQVVPWFIPLLLYSGRVFFGGPLYYKTWEEYAEFSAWLGLVLQLWLKIHAPFKQRQ
jgi:hypothetical protein